MKTKSQIIAELKTKNPTLRSGSEESGYVDLTETEYEATIAEWADNLLEAETVAAEVSAAKTAAEAKLAAIGLTPEDLKALGL